MKTDYKVGDKVWWRGDCHVVIEVRKGQCLIATSDNVDDDNYNDRWVFMAQVEPYKSKMDKTEIIDYMRTTTSKQTLKPSDISHIGCTQTIKINPKPFPTFADYEVWFQQQNSVDIFKKIYNYFAKFGVRELVNNFEVFPEVGKEYEFSDDGEDWFIEVFENYETDKSRFRRFIRPIQPSRLDELKARKSELSKDELLELIELMEKK
jgi:hypothetical protein